MDLAPDRRRHERRTIPVLGFIEVLGRARMICRIHNISDGGALIEPRERGPVPTEFGLRVGHSNVLIDCERVRESGGMLAVAFLPQFGLPGAAVRRAIKNAQAVLAG